MKYILAIILLAFCFYPEIPKGRPEYEYLIGLMFLSTILSLKLCKKIHWSVGIAVAILLISGFYELYFPRDYQVLVDVLMMARRQRSEIFFSLVSIVLFSSILLLESTQFFKAALKLLFISAFLDSCVLIFNHYILGQDRPFAMLNNGTADSTFIACMLPMAFEDYKGKSKYCIGIMIFALILCRSNTGMAALYVGYASWLLTKESFKKWSLTIIPLTLSMLAASYFVLGSRFLGNSGRFDVWKITWDAYIEHGNYWLGFGTGTFSSWGDAFQRVQYLNVEPGVRYPIWYWLHLEPLQILFENGIIGLASAITVYGFILKKTFKRSIVFPIACVYGLIGLTEMPLRLWVEQLLGVCLIAIAFSVKESPQSTSENLPS